ncbi:MAG TPA: restriction endonuclease subunit S [Candidatus Competibacter sp.]|nr:restriction endonuclease subunit S [Candidatus Competibacter sp.]
MVDAWPFVRLGEICQVTSSKRIYAKELVPSGVPFLKSTEIIEKVNGQDHSSLLYISEKRYQEIVKQTGGLEAGDVLLTSRGTLGIPYVVRSADRFHFADGNLTWFRYFCQLDSRYLSYFFMSPLGKAELTKCVIGSSQAAYTIAALKKIEIALPPLPTQRRIAGILSAYDELIENSQRRIKILESMARAFYREWFVRFRFPGHESVPRVASPLGEIPQGWEVKRLADVAKVNHAQINARSAPEELHYIDISSVSPGQIDSITTYAFADAPGRARRIVQHGDVLWSCVRPNRRSHAQVMHPEANTIASTGFAVLTATKVPFTFLYFATTTDDFVAYLTNNATGAAYPAVTAPTFEKADLLVPSVALLRKFGDATIPMAEEIHALQRQIQNLRRTRDLLLPRLLSGQIDVEALDHA